MGKGRDKERARREGLWCKIKRRVFREGKMNVCSGVCEGKVRGVKEEGVIAVWTYWSVGGQDRV